MKAKQRNRPVVPQDLQRIYIAVTMLNDAQRMLRAAAANNAAAYVARAIKSTQGALRHARGRLDRQRAGA